MLAVEQLEQGDTTNIDQGQTTSSETLSETGSESFENIADDIVKLDGKINLLTDANDKLERQRDKLLFEKVGIGFIFTYSLCIKYLFLF